MRLPFYITIAADILDECAQISAKNKTDREKMLAKQADFQKRFAETQANIQALREAIKKSS